LSDTATIAGTRWSVVIPHKLRLVVTKVHVPHDLELDAGDLHGLLEHDPRDGLVQGRRGQAAQVGPVALAGGQEPGGVNWLLQTQGVSFSWDVLEHFTEFAKLWMFFSNLE